MGKNRQYHISWSDINLFLDCPRCFYNKKKLNIKRPGMDPNSFRLSNAVDNLRKEECDFCFDFETPLKIMEKNEINVVPYERKYVLQWRRSYYDGGGIGFKNMDNNLHLLGSIDDVFINEIGELIIVDFKSTSSKSGECVKKSKWNDRYTFQISFYSWILKNNGYKMHNVGYIIHSDAYRKSFDFYPFNNRMYFKTSLVETEIDYKLVKKTLDNVRNCLDLDEPPFSSRYCCYCSYFKKISVRHYCFGKEKNG